MRLVPILVFAGSLAVSACGSAPPAAPPVRPLPPPVRVEPAPVPTPEVRAPAPPAAPAPPPQAPRASITQRSVYPEANLTEWTLANGARVVFEYVAGADGLALVATAPGGTAGLDPEAARAAQAAVAARSAEPTGRLILGDAARRIDAQGPVREVGRFLARGAGFGRELDDAAPGAPRRAPEAAFLATPAPEPEPDDALFGSVAGAPGAYRVAVVGDAEIAEVEGFVAGAFAGSGRRPLAFGEADPVVPAEASSVDAGPDAVATLVYRGRLGTTSQAQLTLAALAAARAVDGSASARADAVTETYTVAVTVAGRDVAAVAARLAGLGAPDDLRRLVAQADAPASPEAAQHLLNWHVRGGSPLRYEPYGRALAEVSPDALSATLRRVFGAGAYRAVLGLRLTP